MPQKRGGRGGSSKAASTPQPDGRSSGLQEQYVRHALQSNVVALKERLGAMAKDTAALRRANVDTARHTADFVVYLQDDIERKDGIIRELRDEKRDIEFAAGQEVKRLKAEHEAAFEALQRKHDEVESELRGTIASLTASLTEVREFRDSRARYNSELDAVKELLEQERKRRREETAEMQRRMLSLKSDWRESRQAELSAMQAQARGEAQRQLDTDVKRMVLNNKRMEEELTFHKEQAELARREKRALAEQAKSLAREVALFADTEALYARKAALRARENKDLKGKVKALEGSLGSLARDFKSHREHVAGSVTRETEELVTEVGALRTLLASKNKELRAIKKLAEMVLSQRSEVEQFLLEALADVKREVRAEEAAAARTAAMAHATAATHGTGGTGTLVPSVRGVASAVASGGKAVAGAGAVGGRGGPGHIKGSGSFNLTVPGGVAGRQAKRAVKGRSALHSAGSAALAGTLPTPLSAGRGVAPRSTPTPTPTPNQTTRRPGGSRGAGWRGMSAVDREKVLSLLFAKVNMLQAGTVTPGEGGGVRPPTAATAPPLSPSAMAGPFGLSMSQPETSLPQLTSPHPPRHTPAPFPASHVREGGAGGVSTPSLPSTAPPPSRTDTASPDAAAVEAALQAYLGGGGDADRFGLGLGGGEEKADPPPSPAASPPRGWSREST